MLVKVCPKILFGSVKAMTIFPFIFVKEAKLKNNQVLMNHEKIHIRQQLEMLILPFFIVYLAEWLVRLFMEGNAYRNISFEREAYTYQYNLSYLKSRKWYSFYRFFKKPALKKICSLSGSASIK